MRSKIVYLVALLVLALSVSLVTAQDAGVTLTESETTWETLAYELDADNGMVAGSVDRSAVMEHTFKTYILENEYLKVTLVPEYGGRILSMIYKPTGHEQLYQNPLGVPFGIEEGNFYYDWLIVYGGIFPTLPEPEHGKSWLVPWDFSIVTESPDEVTVAMSFVDNIEFEGTPGKFDRSPTGIEATFSVTLRSGRAALDTQVLLRNPGDEAVDYEYWTCTTLAPGSVPGETRTTAGAEIIAPVDVIKMPPWWPDTLAQEERADDRETYTFNNLRFFENWPDMGIAYAYPDLQEANFWGVINHDNEEGIFRIGNNDVSLGLKMWTWGYDSTEEPASLADTTEFRPYIELWAGVTPEFFSSTSLEANAEVVIEETYSPTVGLTNVTHATRDEMANFYTDDAGSVHLQLFSVQPGREVSVRITADDAVVYDVPAMLNADQSSDITAEIPAGSASVEFALIDADGSELLSGQLAS